MKTLLLDRVIPAAYSILPPEMATPAATAMLFAIAMQESRMQHRLQIRGPARGFWQFERSGVTGVLAHPRTSAPISAALYVLRYPPSEEACVAAIEHNDVLAACFARCLLWTVPHALPSRDQPQRAWDQYISGWRPGKPRHETWAGFYEDAWTRVDEAASRAPESRHDG